MKSGINVLPAIYPDRRATQPIYSPVSTTLCCIIEAFSFRWQRSVWIATKVGEINEDLRYTRALVIIAVEQRCIIYRWIVCFVKLKFVRREIRRDALTNGIFMNEIFLLFIYLFFLIDDESLERTLSYF